MANSSFFRQGETPTGTILAPGSPTGVLNDIHVQSGSVANDVLTLNLTNGSSVSISLGGLQGEDGNSFTIQATSASLGPDFGIDGDSALVLTNNEIWLKTSGTWAGTGDFLSVNAEDSRLYVAATEPSGTIAEGAIWINTGVTPHVLNIRTSGSWVPLESGSTIQINEIEVENPDFRDTSGSRGVVFSRLGSLIGARANSDDDKQDNLTADQLAVVNAQPFTTADEARLDAIPDYTGVSNLPRLTADLVADRTYVVWVTNNTGTTPAAIDRTAIDIQGQDAATLQGTTVSVTAGRTIPLYVTWNSTAVGDIQNNATVVEPTVTFITPAATVHVATGEDAADEASSYSLSRENNDGTSDQATIILTEGTSTPAGMVHIRGQNEITVGESEDDANTILIDYQVIPPIHPENLSISVNPTHLIEVPTGNISLDATVTLRETGTNWRISGVTNPTASRPGVSFGATTGIGTQSVSIPVRVTQDALRTTGNISLSFRVSGNNGLEPSDPDYQQYRSVVRSVNIGVSPVWYAAVLTSAPTALSEFGDSRGVFRIDAQVSLTGIEDGVIYLAIPTDAVDERVRFTTSNPNIFYEFTTGNAIGDFSVFNLGSAAQVGRTSIVRIGGV